jgi:hypothetical protein
VPSPVHGCNVALVGTGEVRDRMTGETIQGLRWPTPIRFADPAPDLGQAPITPLSGRRLREAGLALLEVTDQPLTIAEIERLLRLHHLVPAGRASQTISNALRPAVADGRIEAVESGCYARRSRT